MIGFLIVQTSFVSGMDSTSPRLRRNTNHAKAPEEQRRLEQALLTAVTAEEVSARISKAACQYQLDRFGMYNARGQMIDLHHVTVELDKDIYVKEQLIPCLIAERLVIAKETRVAVSKDELTQEITKNVLAVWNAQKNTRKK